MSDIVPRTSTNTGQFPVPDVAVIVLTWNQRDLTLDCLASLGQLDYPPKNLQIVVVDNGSVDGTVAAIRQAYPEVIVLENKENLGFAAGNNIGIRHALEGAADYILLLNNDTIVDPAMLADLVTYAGRHDDVGIVTPKIYYHAEPQTIWSAGAHIDWTYGTTARLDADSLDQNKANEPRQVDFASGCALCIKREVVEEIGVLDPRYFIYYEETDWCVRVRKAGWRIMYIPYAKLWHRVSSAMGASSPATDYYMHRNALLFFAQHTKGINRLRLLARLFTRQALTILAYTVKSHNGRRSVNRDARIFALRDAALGRWGRMGEDIAKVAHPRSH